jgi:23S rRNA (adenine2503-C2)-methyltransferase
LLFSSGMTRSVPIHSDPLAVEERLNFFDYDRGGLEELFLKLEEPSFRARQVLQWMYHRRVTDIGAMTDLSLPLRRRLKRSMSFDLPVITQEQESIDGTRKWLLQLADGNEIETVFIPEENRKTLCVSSQAGCALNCAFCATARLGFSRNLTAAEIIGQLWLAEQTLNKDQPRFSSSITNVVMMGMGEPLLNYSAVIIAMRLMLDDLSFGLSRRRVTLSTAGLVPAIDRLAEDCPVSLAVSLHASDDGLRDQLVPLNRKFPISTLLDACRRYVRRDSRGQVTFEYIMLEGINDSEKQATQLCALLADVPSKVNLIPYNDVADTGFRSSRTTVIEKFRDILLRAGIMTITRKNRGRDIDAACGQLAGRVSRQGGESVAGSS